MSQPRPAIHQYIANRPFGVIAGKIQYKHASVAMFEGYAGVPHGDFRRTVEQERVLGQLDDVVAYCEAYLQGDEPGGPASSRLKQKFDHVRDTLGDLPGRVLDQKRLRASAIRLSSEDGRNSATSVAIAALPQAIIVAGSARNSWRPRRHHGRFRPLPARAAGREGRNRGRDGS